MHCPAFDISLYRNNCQGKNTLDAVSLDKCTFPTRSPKWKFTYPYTSAITNFCCKFLVFCGVNLVKWCRKNGNRFATCFDSSQVSCCICTFGQPADNCIATLGKLIRYYLRRL